MKHYKTDRRKIILFVFLMAILILFSISVYSQTGKFLSSRYYKEFSYRQNYSSFTLDSVQTKVGEWRWGPCYSAAVKGNYAYIGNGLLLQVLDISNPANPTVVGELYTGGSIRKIIISGNYAYTIFPFQIIDISDPTNPVLVKTLQLPVYQSRIFNNTNYYNALKNDKAEYIRLDLAAKQKLPWYNIEMFMNINNLTGENETYIMRGNGFPASEASYGLIADVGFRVNFH